MMMSLTRLSMPALALACALAPVHAADRYAHLYGDPVPDALALRTIVITPQTRHVNAEGGEVIRFIVGDRSFSWAFNIARTVHAFDLNTVAPPGLLQQTVRAYVLPDPKYVTAP
ncbi:MAG TPA: CzcE family metal-binding protein [Noviherbaspirillum sp.]|uniref:CzcE family metal-binding protein n=1 Tax=Noviherbaspirillum sp. TaxID=1926288 RepID=UPI002D427101|nr:CzcE family metal-binding protein [Noviherbaspirillum sp.]HYD96269.1 CzcE family metal-binding protein [Noviherbaspirillum sp.]